MFDGESYLPLWDERRLSTLLGRVYAALRSGEWRTLAELSAACGGSTASVSARIRDLRKERFGGHVIERKRVGDGVFAYRLIGASATDDPGSSPGPRASFWDGFDLPEG